MQPDVRRPTPVRPAGGQRRRTTRADNAAALAAQATAVVGSRSGQHPVLRGGGPRQVSELINAASASRVLYRGARSTRLRVVRRNAGALGARCKSIQNRSAAWGIATQAISLPVSVKFGDRRCAPRQLRDRDPANRSVLLGRRAAVRPIPFSVAPTVRQATSLSQQGSARLRSPHP